MTMHILNRTVRVRPWRTAVVAIWLGVCALLALTTTPISLAVSLPVGAWLVEWRRLLP